jgi:uncharacterized protein (DUF2126 family)/transglutaminase-like putative cysteine protease
MAIHVALKHVTRYKYDRLVGHGPHVVRLRPAPHSRTRILSFSQVIEGGEHFINWQQDPFSNWNARLVFTEPMRELSITVDLVAEMSVLNPFDFFLEESASHYPFTYEPDLARDLAPFLEACPAQPRLKAFLQTIRPAHGSTPRTIDLLVDINRKVNQAVEYTIRLEPGVQEPEETLAKATGSCRDSAWLLTHALRHLGLAARFVSGYLIQLAADVKSLDGPSGPEADFTDLHAWCEVYLPGAGWIGLDPTSGLLAGEGHIPLSCTPEPKSAAPVTGAVDECEATLKHHMAVTRVMETPRVTKPYTEEAWERIRSLGRDIDERLGKGDVRLTMGGEPTFVSIDDPDGPEWNFTAVSPAKRRLSGRLLRRLAGRYSPGALLHYGQGKWYPGEQLPRWALSAFWRADGVPIWQDPRLFADEEHPGRHGEAQARELLQGIAEELGVGVRGMMPAYEDVFYYTWRERRLPANVNPLSSNLADPMERERLARVFQKGLGSVVGYALPVQGPAASGMPGWQSGEWFLRDGETLWLIPGDSSMGLRLPLDSVPWVSKADYPWLRQHDPMDDRLPELPKSFPRQRFVGSADPLREGAAGQGGPGGGRRQPKPQPARQPPEMAPAPGQSAPWVIRTALCVEPRDGRLHVFMPPVAATEDYLDLVGAVEAAAEHTGYPVVIEGEQPPKDYRIHKFSVTPDPGVIEVNLHPSHSWEELVDRTTVLYEEARETRLGTEKFMVDGRHTGTGGGNHILIGGATPADSPVLRRPDLLRSLIAFWQNHPSLSRLFSGLFIGPTSQAPRVDEARNDSLREMELAFSEMDRQLGQFGKVPPWMADRLLRNLLIDASGNTHRSEFSIDKLYSPDGPSGRLGLVEMRAFEMPPHARMSLAQHLLLRGLVSVFWDQPYRRDLVRWGTDIQDRWLLPHYCRQDFHEVLDHLRSAGLPFEDSWFDPHYEFRFPKIGDFNARGVEVELRAALEPWHVLGEEAGGGGTVRYVDSSLERVQVTARGLAGDRFALACNGRRVPLMPTGANGEAVAGVRFRAWQPPECLQPTIGVHAPLVFDLIDTWNERSLGGCSYHVAHPGGRSYDTFPVNANEAESRRLARFFRHGHTPGRVAAPVESPHPDHPHTLDLRAR